MCTICELVLGGGPLHIIDKLINQVYLTEASLTILTILHPKTDIGLHGQ